jgi:hypothetical protein
MTTFLSRFNLLAAIAITILSAFLITPAEARTPGEGAFLADANGNCPKDHQRVSQMETGRPASKWCMPPKARSSSSGSSSSSSSGATYVDPVFGEVAKPIALVRCPTGHYTKGDVCSMSWEDAPKSRAKTGACPAGTIEEWKAFCTEIPKDTSDKALDRMDGSNTRDFNAVFVAYQVANKAPPSSSEEPAAFIAAKASRAAAGNPWQSKSERDRAEAAAKQAAMPVEPPLNRADVSPQCQVYMPERSAVAQCEGIIKQQRAAQTGLGLTPPATAVGAPANEAGKAVGNAVGGAVGGALKGLFGK